MLVERVGGGVGRGQHLDVPRLEEPARGEARRGERSLDLVVDALGRAAVQLFLHAKDAGQLVRQPQAGGGAAEEVEMVGKGLPALARVVDVQQLRVGHALRVEHAQEVVVGGDEQGQRISEVIVRQGEERRVHVPMRRDDRQRADAGIQLEGDALLLRVGIKVAIGRALYDHSSTISLEQCQLRTNSTTSRTL